MQKLKSKKYLAARFTAILLILFSITARSQQEEDPEPLKAEDKNAKFHFGVNAGVGIHTITSKEFVNIRPKPGMVVGVNGYYRFKKLAKFQMEVSGSYRGCMFDNKAFEYGKLSLFYIDMPAYFIFRFDKKETICPFIGLQGSILMSSYFHKVEGGMPADTGVNLKKNDISFVGGLQFNFNHVSIQAKYISGLMNINHHFNTSFLPPQGMDNPIKNSGVQLCLFF